MTDNGKIPKVIHYCWLGRGELSPKLKKCLATWQEKLHDYEIIEWNEDNFDVNMTEYTKQAYKEKKYAFVTDFMRLHILYHYGGIYLDTDVEVLKSYDDLLGNDGFIGLENGRIVGPDTMGSIKGNKLLKEVIDSYYDRSFIKDDGSYDYEAVSSYMTRFFKSEGMVQENKEQEAGGFHIYPSEYFHPLDFWTKKLTVTEKTYSIHRWTESWKSFPERMKTQFHRFVGNDVMKFLAKIKQGIKRS